MKLSLIVAMDQKGVIGRDNSLPWHLSADLKHFKALTMGKPVIMGRKTHESIGRPLPGRRNIIISRDLNYVAGGCEVCNSVGDALTQCSASPEVMVMGGRDIFQETLPLAERIYLTEVHADIPGDVFFPAFARHEWEETDRQLYPADDKNDYPFSFVLLEKRRK